MKFKFNPKNFTIYELSRQLRLGHVKTKKIVEELRPKYVTKLPTDITEDGRKKRWAFE